MDVDTNLGVLSLLPVVPSIDSSGLKAVIY